MLKRIKKYFRAFREAVSAAYWEFRHQIRQEVDDFRGQ